MDEHVAGWVKRLRRTPLLPVGHGEPVVGPSDVARMLSHRPPMLLLDAVLAVDPKGGRLRARRTLDALDPIFAGHFPECPVYPGVLLIEAMAQAALAALPFIRSGNASLPEGYLPPAARFTRVRDAAFLAPVTAGDVIEVHAEAIDDGLVVRALGQVYRGDVLCAYAVSEAYLDE